MKKLKDAIAGIAGSAIPAILAGLIFTLGAGVVPSTASAADPIRIGDINSYKRLPAHTVPYKMGVELASRRSTRRAGCSAGRSSSCRGTMRASPARR